MLSPSVVGELKRIFGENDVLTSPIKLEAYAYDSSPFFAQPEAVVLADSTEEVSLLMELASRHNIVVIARGAGTTGDNDNVMP